jgi:hypothetical protein
MHLSPTFCNNKNNHAVKHFSKFENFIYASSKGQGHITWQFKLHVRAGWMTKFAKIKDHKVSDKTQTGNSAPTWTNAYTYILQIW